MLPAGGLPVMGNLVENSCLRWYDIFGKVSLCKTGGTAMNRNLTKRIMSLLLVLVLLISNVPAVVFAAEETTAATGEIVVAETSAPTEAEEPETEAAMAAKLELEATIEKQIRAFAKSIDKPGADDDAAREIALLGMFGRGKKLSVGKSHALTAALMNSELGLATVIQGCALASNRCSG